MYRLATLLVAVVLVAPAHATIVQPLRDASPGALTMFDCADSNGAQTSCSCSSGDTSWAVAGTVAWDQPTIVSSNCISGDCWSITGGEGVNEMTTSLASIIDPDSDYTVCWWAEAVSTITSDTNGTSTDPDNGIEFGLLESLSPTGHRCAGQMNHSVDDGGGGDFCDPGGGFGWTITDDGGGGVMTSYLDTYGEETTAGTSCTANPDDATQTCTPTPPCVGGIDEAEKVLRCLKHAYTSGADRDIEGFLFDDSTNGRPQQRAKWSRNQTNSSDLNTMTRLWAGYICSAPSCVFGGSMRFDTLMIWDEVVTHPEQLAYYEKHPATACP